MTAFGGGPTPGSSFTEKLNQAANLLSNAVILFRNPNIGVKGLDRVAGLAEYGLSLLREATGTNNDLVSVNAQIVQLVTENRAPTDEEWAAWDSRLRAVDERIARVRNQQ